MNFLCNQMKLLALCLCLVQTAAAQRANTLLEIDSKPVYEEWNTKFKVDKLEYHESYIVLHFMVVHKDPIYGTYYPPTHRQAWYLRDEKGRTYPLRGLNDLEKNGQLEEKYVTKITRVADDNNVKINVIRCKLYFDRLPDDVKRVDLIEGSGFEDFPNSYNAFKIKVKNFPKIAPPRA